MNEAQVIRLALVITLGVVLFVVYFVPFEKKPKIRTLIITGLCTTALGALISFVLGVEVVDFMLLKDNSPTDLGFSRLYMAGLGVTLAGFLLGLFNLVKG